MSLAGLRDISVIETPPEGRRPVRTYVGEYDEDLVKRAMDRELARGGQVFFLHNRVETIDETAERIRALCPSARVSVAHGQMAEGALEKAMLDEAVAGLGGTSADEAPEPVRVDVPVDAYVPADYVPYEAAKIEIHRRVSGAREVAELILLREELEDRFGAIPEPLENLIKLQDARIKLGRAGARRVDFRGGRMRVTPIELDSKATGELRAEVPDAVYESGRTTVVLRMPDEPQERFAALVRAAEVVLKVASEPPSNP